MTISREKETKTKTKTKPRVFALITPPLPPHQRVPMITSTTTAIAATNVATFVLRVVIAIAVVATAAATITIWDGNDVAVEPAPIMMDYMEKEIIITSDKLQRGFELLTRMKFIFCLVQGYGIFSQLIALNIF